MAARAPDPARRALLRGKIQPPVVIRPPWAWAEPEFLDACSRCNDCIERCPEHVLVSGPGGYPQFDPSRGECTFCGDCADACSAKALDRQAVSPPWHWIADISNDSCLTHHGVICASCQDGCGERAIRFQPALGAVPMPIIDATRCTGCGACVGSCPTQAISLKNMPCKESSDAA